MKFFSRDTDLRPRERVMIASMPKAGTYFFAALLEALGYRDTHLHFHVGQLDVYDPARMEETRRYPERFRINIPFADAVRFVRMGEFAVGHLPATPLVTEALKPLRVLFVTRNVRSALVSRMRFDLETQRYTELNDLPWFRAHDLAAYIQNVGDLRIKTYENMLGWQEAGAFRARFEDFHKGNSDDLKQLTDYLGLPCPSPKRVFRRVLATDTMTKARTTFPLAWNDAAEAAFQQTKGPEVNRRLGYAP